ncbi:MAG: IS66 family transposase [Oscillospiraceae bacterium]|nr:IS66 family transposase [Oscillospiraceae bacterium]
MHADETALQVLHETGKKAQSKSYIWLYRTGIYAEHPIALYEYQPDRKQIRPQEFLHGFQGYLQTDGYAGYNRLDPGVIRVGCLAHLRRKFTDAEKASEKGKKSPTVTTAIAYCSKVFKIEEELASLSWEKRYEQRLLRVKPILDVFFKETLI